MSETDEIIVRPATNKDCASVQDLVFSVLREYQLTPCLSETDKDISDIEKYYINRGGVFEILENADGQIIGTVGLYPIDDETIELRKMYFAKSLRGRGFGKKTLQRMIEKAAALGYKRLYLETATVLREAIALYEKFGFKLTEERHTPRCDTAYFLKLDESPEI